jgi:thiosulfate reductase/polysulfide reductase chain A
MFFKKGPGEAGGKAARKLVEQDFPKIEVPRFDKVGTPDFRCRIRPTGFPTGCPMPS